MSWQLVITPIVVLVALHMIYEEVDVPAIVLTKLTDAATRSMKKDVVVSRVAVGLNGNLDMIASATDVFSRIGLQPERNAFNHEVIESADQLADCFAYVFPRCQGTERFVSNSTLFKQLVDAAMQTAGVKTSIGGNAALMGNTLAKRGSKVLLGGVIGPQLAKLLPSSMEYPPETVTDTDEVHLILEYHQNDQWNSLIAPCANRLILHNDIANAELRSLEAFGARTVEFGAQLLLVSGVNIMEGLKDEEYRLKRLQQLSVFLQTISPSIPIHLELASFGDPKFLRLAAQTLFPLVDSVGLNEQELSLVVETCDGPAHTVTIRDTPRIALVADALHWLLHSRFPHHSTKSRLSRVHFHSLSFHMTAQRPQVWSHTQSSTAWGSLTATRQACNFTGAVPSSAVQLRLPAQLVHDRVRFDPRRAAKLLFQEWSKDHIEFAYAPVLVCKRPVHTVGLGDAISATGIQYAQFNQPSP